MRQAQPAAERVPVTAQDTARRLRLAPPVIATAFATALGITVLVLAVALVPLAILARQNPDTNGGETLLVLPFAAVGFVLARRRPGNPLGWLLLAVATCFLLSNDSGFYAAAIYRLGHHLPLGLVALVLYELWGPALGVLLMVILLFPDGWPPPGPWRKAALAYSAVVVLFEIALVTATLGAVIGHRVRLDGFDGLAAIDHPTGWFAVAQALFGIAGVPALACVMARQVLTWRRSSGERRQQLKWLASGAIVAGICLILSLLPSGSTAPAARLLSNVLLIGVAALPVSIGVAILKYRLYDIDRIISRTLAYALVTGLLVGMYAGLVLLATRVLSVDSPVAVAASTLAAAAVFNPLRRRVQRAVDRRFNRARYDADQTVTAFAARLKDAVDLDSVQADLAGIVQQALEPDHVSLWISAPD
jgi:hypothetical protein